MFDDNLFLNSPRSTIEMPTFLLEAGIFNSLPAADKLFLWRRSRAVAVWNQRASLLKALDNGLGGTARSNAEREIALINNWFARQHYDSDIDAATGQTVTQLVDPARLRTLAEQNNRAAQEIAASTVAADLVRIGTDLANVVNQNVGGSVRADAGRPRGTRSESLTGASAGHAGAGGRGTATLTVLALVGAAVAVAGFAARQGHRKDQA